MKRYLIAVLIISISSAVLAEKTAVKEYAVKYHRPYVAGERFTMSVTDHERSEMILRSREQVMQNQKEDTTVRFNVLCTVRETTPRGHIRKASYAVDLFTIERGEGKEEVLPKGKVIEAVLQNKSGEFTIDGAPADEGQKKILERVLPGNDESESDEAVFGSAEKKKPGDCWPINAEKAAEEFKNDKVTFDKKSISGKMCLDSVSIVDGTESLTMKGFMNVGDMRYPGVDINIEKSEARMDVAGIFPVDEKKKCLSSTMTMSFSAAGKFQADLPEMKINASFFREKQTKYAPK